MTQTVALRQAKLYLPRQATAPRLIYCGSYIYMKVEGVLSNAARLLQLLSTTARLLWPQQLYILHERHPRVLQRLVYCGASTVGIDAPQFESFYTVPFIQHKFVNSLTNTVQFCCSIFPLIFCHVLFCLNQVIKLSQLNVAVGILPLNFPWLAACSDQNQTFAWP